MKKIMAVLLSLCLLIGSVGFAQTATVQGSLTYMGQSLADILAQIGQDDDGCYQFRLKGNVQDQLLDIAAQLSEQSVVFGSGDQMYEITAENLGIALMNVAKAQLGEETVAMIAAAYAYYTQGGFEADSQVLSQVLQNEIMRVVMLAQTNGIVTVAEDGTVTIHATEENLLATVKGYLASLAEDANVFALLASTQAWSMLGLSENGENERQAVAGVAAQLENVSIQGVDLELLAVVNPTGTVDASLTLVIENSLDLSVKAMYDGASFSASVVESALESEPITASIVYADGALSITAHAEELDYNYNLRMDGSKITIAWDETVAQDTNCVHVAVNEVIDTEAMTLNGEMTLGMGETLDEIEETMYATITFDMVNGFEEKVIVYPLEMTAVAYAKPIATEQGNGIKVNMSATQGEIEMNDIFDLELIVGQTISLTSELNDYMNDGTKENVYQLACALDPASLAIQGMLATEDGTYEVAGALGEDHVYTLSLSMNGLEMAKATLAVDPEMGLGYSLLMGELHVTLYDGTEIVRTAEMYDNGVEYTLTITSNGITQTYKASVTTGMLEDGTQYIEVSFGNDAMSYVLDAFYTGKDNGFDAELKLVAMMGEAMNELADLKLSFELSDEDLPRLSGTQLSAEQIEQIINSLIEQLSSSASSYSTLPGSSYGYGA